MSVSWRRPSTSPTDNEFSLAQSDEIQIKASLAEKSKEQRSKSRWSTVQLSEQRKKWIVWIIHFIGFMDLFSVSMMIPLFPKLMRNLGASHALAGLIGSLYGMLQVFSSPIVGKLSDVYGRKSLLLLSYVGPFFGYIVMGLSGSLLVLVISRIPNGILKHGLSVSKAYLADIASSSSERQSVLGMFNAISSLGFIFGPLIGGYLADMDPSLQLSLLTGAGVFGLNFLLVAILLPSSSSNSDTSVSNGNEKPDNLSQWIKTKFSLSQILDSLNIFKGLHWRELFDVIVIRFLMTFSVIIFRTNFTLFLEEHFQISNTTFGQILSFNGIASALASATSGMISKLYSSHVKQVLHFTLLLASSIACMTMAPNVASVLLILIPLSLSTSNLRICLLSLMLERGKEEERGAIVGLANSMSSVSRMLAPSIVGVSQEYSVEFAGYLSALLALAAAGLVLYYPIEHRDNSASQTSKKKSS